MQGQSDRSSTTEPSVVALLCVKAFNAGDDEGALTYFGDDAEAQVIGLRPGRPDSFAGKEQLRAWFKKLAGRHLQLEVEVIETNGGIVTTKALAWSDLARQLGVAPLAATGQVLVQDGLIRSAVWTIHAESAAKLHAALSHAQEWLCSADQWKGAGWDLTLI